MSEEAQGEATGVEGGRPPREGAPAAQRYRIEVGRRHGAEPRHIVGAITNEAQLASREIGQIKILDDHSLVDLPAHLPPRIVRHLQKVWVCGQQLRLHPEGEAAPPIPARSPRSAPARDREKTGPRLATKKGPPPRRGPKEG